MVSGVGYKRWSLVADSGCQRWWSVVVDSAVGQWLGTVVVVPVVSVVVVRGGYPWWLSRVVVSGGCQ